MKKCVINKKTLDIVAYTSLFVLNAVCSNNNILGIIFASFQLLLLVYFFIKRKINKYIIYLFIFYTTAFEIPQFVSNDKTFVLYSFFRLPMIQGYHVYVLLIMPLFYIWADKKLKVFHKSLKRIKPINLFLKGIFILTIVGIISSIFGFLSNDNNIANSTFFYIYWRRELLIFLSLFLMAFYLTYFMLINPKFVEELKITLECILLSLLPSSIIISSLGLLGAYGSNEILMMPLVSFFGSVLTIFPFYILYRSKKSYFIYGIVLSIVMTSFPSPLSGKWWLLIISLPILVIYIYFTRTKPICKIIFYPIMLIAIVLVSIAIINNSNIVRQEFKANNIVTEGKIIQALMLLSIWEDGWYENLPSSPKFRIDEFINIGIEYKRKPQYMLFGKGFGGSILQHTDNLDWVNANGAFPSLQAESRIYVSLHETLNVIFLKFGVLGISFFICILTFCFIGIRKNPWIFIGMIWFLFFLFVYSSLYLGLASLLYGFYTSE